MNKITNLNGQCLCKKVTIKASNVEEHIDACHCTMCRKWSGSALLAVDCGQEVSFGGQTNITTYDSSEWAERGFCQHCGTHLFYKLKHNQKYIVPVGLFDTDSQFDFKTQIFIEEKPEYYGFANKTKNMTGEEIFADFNGDD
jgi:hypothetical protein